MPLLAATELLGLAPVLALGIVNGLAAALAIAALFRCVPSARAAVVAAWLFLLSGTTFYLAWTGPEVLTAAAVLAACLAASDAKLGLGVLAGGVAAVRRILRRFFCCRSWRGGVGGGARRSARQNTRWSRQACCSPSLPIYSFITSFTFGV